MVITITQMFFLGSIRNGFSYLKGKNMLFWMCLLKE